MLRLSTAAIAVALTPAALAVSINEIQPNPNGQDASTQQIELLGTAGASFSGVLLSIESDGPNGTVDRLSTINGTFDANGLLVVDINDLENPSNTLILLDSFSGSLGDDLDVDGDGMLDASALSAFGTVYDAVGIADSPADESSLYASQVGGTNLAYSGDEPQLKSAALPNMSNASVPATSRPSRSRISGSTASKRAASRSAGTKRVGISAVGALA
ncbi:MAG: hypothetical protein AAFR44_03950, partial [Pseudomonadota bacterium]